MLESIKNIKYYKYFVFALAMTAFTFYFDYFRIGQMNNIRDLVLLGSPGFGEQFSQYITNKNIILPPIIFWAILGILAYFIYYTLNTLYYFAYNNAVIQLFYANKPKTLIEPPKFKKRVVFDFALVILYLVLIGLFVGILTPLSITIKNIIASSGNEDLYFYLSILAVCLYWLAISSLFGIFLLVVKVEQEEVELGEAHNAV